MKRTVFRIIARGGLGDILLSTPVFGALKRQYPLCKIIVFCLNKNTMDVYKNNPNIDMLRARSVIANPGHYILYLLKPEKFKWLNYDRFVPSLTFRKSAPEMMAEMFDVKLHCSKLEVYLTKEEEQWGRKKVAEFKNPIAIHITSVASKNQHWPLNKWEQLVKSLPQYTFVQLGLPNEEKVEGAVDLRGKTSFRESLSILRSSLSFVGVVSSFAHATSAFGIPGVVLFGASTPLVWGHSNNINLYKGLRCAPCIDTLLSSPCPYGKPCMTTITVVEVRDALLSQLDRIN